MTHPPEEARGVGGNSPGASELVKLHYWTIRELHDGKRHLVGSELVRGKWSPHVSSALAELKLALRSARGIDGRVYQLVGRRHWTLESDTLFAHFCGKQGHGLGVDVTHALIDALHDEELARTMRATRP